MFVQSGNNVMVGGFIIYGESPKRVMLRGIGPSLATFGIPDAMPDPVLELFDTSGATLAFNDDWHSAQRQTIQETGLAPTNDREAALVTTLSPGSYTVVVKDASNSSGVALFELYDLDPSSSQLLNLSTRGKVETQDRITIGGFVIYGAYPTAFIVRAIGPSLAQAGVTNALLDPTLELHDADGMMILQNDDWRSDQEQEILGSNLAPTDDRESAIFAVLAPGPYSAIVRGAGNSTGIALVEIYRLVP